MAVIPNEFQMPSADIPVAFPFPWPLYLLLSIPPAKDPISCNYSAPNLSIA